jgi:hypothetical protein
MPVSGSGATFTSAGTTTYQGAFGEEVCVPKTSQMSQEAGQAFVALGTVSPFSFTTATNLANCIANCNPPDTMLCLAQWNTTAGTCATATLQPIASNNTASAQLVYKLPPSTIGSASSVSNKTADAPADGSDPVMAKTMPSGYYAHGQIQAGALSQWSVVGSNLTSDARTFSRDQQLTGGVNTPNTLALCKRACDNSNVCIGFIWQHVSGGTGTCNFRGGIDATNSVAFFDMPINASDVGGFRW